MPTANPVFHGGWTMKKFQATVINDIWPEVLFFSSIATMVTLVSLKTSHSLAIDSQLMTVLGTVLGLVISFRTSSAYERYQEGRKMWTSITVASRNLAQMIWIHVPNERIAKDKQQAQSNLASVIEKKSMINVVQAFSVAVKHFLRGENGVYYQDLYPLICFLPRYAGDGASATEMLPLWQGSEDGEHPMEHGHSLESASTLPSQPPRLSPPRLPGSTFDPEKALPMVQTHRPLKPARNPPPASIFDYLPFLLIFKWMWKKLTHAKNSVLEGERRDALGRKIKPQLGDSNVPMEITIFLSNYAAFLMRSALLQPPIANGILNGVASLQDTLNNLERIGSTPLPFAYQAHLRMSLWIYLLLLPFQIFENFGYLTIPGTAFASFLLLGFLEIGQEIENPFNYDGNDLDLDGFCLAIERELQEVTAHPAPDPSSFLFTAWNQPFAPADRRTAEELVRGHTEYGIAENDSKGMDHLRRTMLKSWRDVETETREMKY
ncbi:UPF0187-domain-containing protein [Hymenopellis radicata]|nr:UPF0187-domain-containing protein [Hymenopellis radicata]